MVYYGKEPNNVYYFVANHIISIEEEINSFEEMKNVVLGWDIYMINEELIVLDYMTF